MIAIDDARAAIAAAARPLPVRRVPLSEALGCRLAAPVFSGVDLPSADVSAMDGYAVRRADLAASAALPVLFEVPAGTVPPPLSQRAAARIFTGALLPGGADTVIEQELAEPAEGGEVRLQPLPAGSNVRRRGELFGAGEELARPGDMVTPQRVALLAAGGAVSVVVIPRPRVTVISTGSELAGPGTAHSPGQILDSNGPLLDALTRGAGLAPPRRLRVADDRQALRAQLERARAGADLLVTTGGVSVGDYDLVPGVVEELGGEILFHRVNQKPGKPVLAARLGGAWLVGLPGNPLAVLTGWRLYAFPLLRTLAGDPEAFDEELVAAELTAPAANAGRRTVLRPAKLVHGKARTRVTILEWKGSHDVAAGAAANALARLEPGVRLDAGEIVLCYPL